MVAVDHGPSAQRLCRFAAAIAASTGEVLHAVHIGSRAKTIGTDVEVLADALDPARREFPELEIETHVESGPTEHTLLDRAREHATVSVGSRRLGAVGRMFLGSVSHALVTNARCPTIVLPPARDPHGTA
jgi:nucleotide-binding universal stress UspA family protein